LEKDHEQAKKNKQKNKKQKTKKICINKIHFDNLKRQVKEGHFG